MQFKKLEGGDDILFGAKSALQIRALAVVDAEIVCSGIGSVVTPHYDRLV